MVAQLILNADDFGSSPDVNAAVARARRDGLLTSASLMVTGEHVAEAVDIARADRSLAVGLHLTLSNGRSLLPATEIPLLVDGAGRFADSPARAAWRYCFDARTLRQLRCEIEAQFRAFAQTGLTLSHVDGHQHLHLHPAVLPIALEQAARYHAAGIRVPRESLWRGLKIDRSGVFRRTVVACGHAYLRSSCRKQLACAGIPSCEASIGSTMSGRMSAAYIIAVLKMTHCSSVEVFCHPSLTDSGNQCGPNRGDLDALLDPELRRFVREQGYELANYLSMREKVHAGELG